MRKLSLIIHLVLVCMLAQSISSAQIPNAGFENWASGAPTDWKTDNVPTMTPITQSSDAYSGSSALKGQVISVLTVGLPPVVFTTFPISSRYGSLKGYYKFSPSGGDSLIVTVSFKKGIDAIAAGAFVAGNSVSSYAQFNAPIYYAVSDVPDSAYIFFTIENSTGITHTGSTFYIDELSFGPATGVEESFSVIPATFSLSQNYPNPFNPSTKISYQLPTDGMVRLEVFNILGKTVATLVNEEKPAGKFTVTFDGSAFTSGIYFCRINAISQNGKSFSQTNKMILVK